MLGHHLVLQRIYIVCIFWCLILILHSLNCLMFELLYVHDITLVSLCLQDVNALLWEIILKNVYWHIIAITAHSFYSIFVLHSLLLMSVIVIIWVLQAFITIVLNLIHRPAFLHPSLLVLRTLQHMHLKWFSFSQLQNVLLYSGNYLSWWLFSNYLYFLLLHIGSSILFFLLYWYHSSFGLVFLIMS